MVTIVKSVTIPCPGSRTELIFRPEAADQRGRQSGPIGKDSTALWQIYIIMILLGPLAKGSRPFSQVTEH